MAYRSVCIGVTKHEDPSINELPGAARDARAVWAVLKDNLPGIYDTLLLDKDATIARIQEVLQVILGDAESEDVVIVSVDHRLA
jgi:helicase